MLNIFWGSNFWSYKFTWKRGFKQKKSKLYIKMNKKSFKFTSRSWFGQTKVEKYKLKKSQINFKTIYKNGWEIMKLDNTEIEI